MSSIDGKPLGLFTPERPIDRPCGDCTLCCKLLPVRSLEKPRDEWCPHCDKKRGCTIYNDRPRDCRLWTCIWSIDGEQGDHLMPRKIHCVFDIMIDSVVAHGEQRPVFQLWVDPAYPGAFRAPAVRDEIERLGKAYGVPILVRIGYRGILVVPSCLDEKGTGFEIESDMKPDAEWGEDDWQIEAYRRRVPEAPL